MQPTNWSKVIILLILFFALSVRLLGINYGMPYVFNADEAMIVNHAMAFGTGDLNPHDFIYPSLYMYVMFFVYGLTYSTGRLIGVFASTNDFVHLFFTDLTLFYVPGRLIAAFSGVASVWLVYKLGRRAYNFPVGLVSAAMLCFSVVHVEFSHFVRIHVPAGLWAIITLSLAWSIYQGQSSWRRYLLAGATAGLAASTFYNAGFSLISVVVAHLLSISKKRDTPFLHTRLLGAVISSFVAFVATTPFALLDWSTFLSDQFSTAKVHSMSGVWELGLFYPFTSLSSGFGQPLGTVALLGLGYALLRHRPADLILGILPLFAGVFLMLFKVKGIHLMLMAYPAIAILAGSFLVDVVKAIFRRRAALQPVVVATVTALLVIAPAVKSFKQSYNLSLPDTRILAKAWVEENIAPGSKIVMDSGKYYFSMAGPPLTPSRWTLERLIKRGRAATKSSELAKRDGTRRVAFLGEDAYFQYQLNVLDDRPGYDIFQILHELVSNQVDALTLPEYLDQGVQYAIIDSDAAGGYLAGNNIYESLRARGTLLKEFRPSEKINGPTLAIYQLQ
jgi:hypothetical protein